MLDGHCAHEYRRIAEQARHAAEVLMWDVRLYRGLIKMAEHYERLAEAELEGNSTPPSHSHRGI